ncbi:MAG: pullulanase-associated domain-containing protein [Caldilineaceae bacterium]
MTKPSNTEPKQTALSTATDIAVMETGTARQAIIHYHRPDGDYGNAARNHYHDFWGLHVWDGAVTPTAWQKPLKPTGQDDFGIYFVVPLLADATELAFIIHRGESKDPEADQRLQLINGPEPIPPRQILSDPDRTDRDKQNGANELWLVADPRAGQTDRYATATGGRMDPDLCKQHAHWLTADTIAWNVAHQPGQRYTLYYAPQGGLRLDGGTISGGHAIPLHDEPGGLNDALKAKFPHLARYQALTLRTLTLPLTDRQRLDTILQSQVAVAVERDGVVLHATGLQLPGVLDEQYAYDGPLGALIDGTGATIRLWAPTAQRVELYLFEDAVSNRCHRHPMQRGPQGTWDVRGDHSWIGKYYQYEVTVFVPQRGQIEHNLVTDPYSLGLALNSTRTLIVDVADPTLYPPGWEQQRRRPLDAPTDIVLYELHLRDFSINDQTVPAPLRGKYGAFTVVDSAGMRHLQDWLRPASRTSICCRSLILFPLTKIPWRAQEPLIPRHAAPDADTQANAIKAVRDQDGFNWGYDPYHYTVPEGSYATDPNGPARIREFRQMIQALHAAGLCVVMDVVYNHMHDGGLDPHAVLDRLCRLLSPA